MIPGVIASCYTFGLRGARLLRKLSQPRRQAPSGALYGTAAKARSRTNGVGRRFQRRVINVVGNLYPAVDAGRMGEEFCTASELELRRRLDFSPRFGTRARPSELFFRRRDTRNPMIRKLRSGEYRLYSRKVDPKTGKRRNLGTFKSRAAAEKHERDVQYFKRH
jgi:hypothetical protein